MVNINRPRENGVALLLVMTTILLVVLVANIVLGIVSSQSRLTKHKIGKIQGYYASLAGVNLAYASLGAGVWPMPAVAGNYTRLICRDATLPGCGGPGVILDPNFPASIQSITIYVRRRGAPTLMPGIPVPACNPPSPAWGFDACIHSVANYTFN
ncbi:MAG: hypothetical protein PHG40_02295 [Candidatus Omnitrophica bacterium]|nr:hypothetical protein [Candidatus Omnitrophota bacterium]